MAATLFIGLSPFQWIALVVASLTLLILADALAGHYRSGFVFRSQFAPFISGGLLILAAVAAVVRPDVEFTSLALRFAGWLAIVSGIVGFAFHHYYGIVKKPGGYKWLLHYLMYGAPSLAPLALATTGVLALLTAHGLANEASIAGMSLRTSLLTLISISLVGATVQAAILHYRGAFNNALMYAPLTAPILAAASCMWVAFFPNSAILNTLTVLLWLTFLMGFVGLGMHLRGLGRQMGGIYLLRFNLLEGPPAWAPALFVGFAALGLIAAHLL